MGDLVWDSGVSVQSDVPYIHKKKNQYFLTNIQQISEGLMRKLVPGNLVPAVKHAMS